MIFFNSSMPRSMSTLLQCILNQNPSIHATPTDPVLEYLYGARINYTSTPEVKAMDPSVAVQTWRGFCRGGLEGYTKAYTSKPHICIKTRGATIHYEWFKNFMPYDMKCIVMVRDMRGIISSMEKLFRQNQEQHQHIQDHAQMTGTNTVKRADIWLQSPPVGLALERLLQCFQEGINHNFLYIRAEDLTSTPDTIMQSIYSYLQLPYYQHDFANIEQTVKEDDSVYGLTNNLHTIRKKLEPVTPDYNTVLGNDLANKINNMCYVYQKLFGYIN